MSAYNNIYRGRKVLLTGHTGFKGSWLALWLKNLGARVVGLSMKAESEPSHWELLNIDCEEHLVDIRDFARVQNVVQTAKPEIVFHLAAQSLVRRSYIDPLLTWSTNVQGTAHLLEACRNVSGIRAIVSVTTDKCYENKEWIWGYRESDRLGGRDPYSASKAGAELVIASYRDSFYRSGGPLVASVRAGNVIGGGDWSEDRLIPDLVRAISCGNSLEIRSPDATRPWQHVLESLSGYLLLGQRLLERDEFSADAWNFGPDESGNQTVRSILGMLAKNWNDLRWHIASTPNPHEATLLKLDSSKARVLLDWRPVWNLEESLTETAKWYCHYLEDGEIISHQQLTEYIELAKVRKISWAT